MITTKFDVSTAYMQSAEEDYECGKIPMRYPKGFRKTKNSAGEELLAVLWASIYGHPIEARAWAKTLNNWIGGFFSTNGWHVESCHSDACLFVICSPDQTFTLLSKYTDDCDTHGERDEDLTYIRK